MRPLLAALAFLVACTPAPVIRPDRDRRPATGPEVQRTVELTEAPGGTVTTRDGGSVDLASLWAQHPVVVIFYRGHWCPHCQYQLGEIQKHKDDFAQRNVTVVAISSDAPSDLTVMRDKLSLTFDLYSDAQLGVIQKWGVEDYGNGISKPATFLVHPGGAISFQKVGDKPDDRPSVDQILAAIDEGKPAT